MRDFGSAGPRLLILDRNYEFARLLRSQLQSLGLRHLPLAEDTATALAILPRDPIHAILVDAETGPLAAPEFIRAVRGSGCVLDPMVPIVVCSFKPTLDKIAACRDAGGNGFLAKPVSVAALREKLATVLLEPRHYVKAKAYFGPNRRKGWRPPYGGPERRTRGRPLALPGPHSA